MRRIVTILVLVLAAGSVVATAPAQARQPDGGAGVTEGVARWELLPEVRRSCSSAYVALDCLAPVDAYVKKPPTVRTGRRALVRAFVRRRTGNLDYPYMAVLRATFTHRKRTVTRTAYAASLDDIVRLRLPAVRQAGTWSVVLRFVPLSEAGCRKMKRFTITVR